MLQVDSKKMLRKVTQRFMKANKSRNIIIILAVVMTTVMFTALLTAAMSLFMTQQQMEMRTMMDGSQIRANHLTKQVFDRLRTDDRIKEQGYTIYLAPAENKALGKSAAELQFADAKGAESRLSMPTKGTMPEEANQVAMSTITMDLLGVPHQVGSSVELTYTLGGKTVTKSFELSGYWKGDGKFPSQPIWVSKTFCEEEMTQASAETIAQRNYEGTYDLAMWFGTPFGLADRVSQLDEKYQITEQGGYIAVNTAYDIFGSDGFDFTAAALVLLVIFISGNLIIYNVFNLSVRNDIRAYGLLMNIGVTGKQLKKMVRMQAMYLSCIGIPLGLILGYFAGTFMAPSLLDTMDYFGSVTVVKAANPMIFLIGAVLSAVTVYMGCRKPARAVSRISPVEAMKLEWECKQVSKKTGKKITSMAMARDNLLKGRKKVLVVVLSLALPLVILNSVYSIAKGFHFEYFVDAYTEMDFRISGYTDFAKTSNLRAVTPEFSAAALERDEVKQAAVVYDTEIFHKLSESEKKALSKILDEAEKSGAVDSYQMKQERKILESGQVAAHVMGLNEDAFDKLQFQGKGCTYEEFVQSDGVIVGVQSMGTAQFYELGEAMQLDLGEGRQKTYQVLGTGDLPYELQYPFATGSYFSYIFMLPEDSYLELVGTDGEGAMAMGVNVKKGMAESFDRWLSSYIEKEEMTLYVQSKLSLEAEAKDYVQKYYLVLGLLCAVLFVIGVMNFFNTMAVSVLNRRKELALLESVGMTHGQVVKMLMAEGLFYLLAAVVLADTVGAVLSLLVIKKTVGTAFFFTSNISIVMSLFALPILIIIAATVPVYLYRRICREPVTVRLRVE